MKKISRIYLLLLLLFLSISSSVHAAEATEMKGSPVPTGTTAFSPGGSYKTTAEKNTIDQDLITNWNSGSVKGQLELKFPQPTYLNFVQLAVLASPQANNTYTISGLKDGKWTQISSPATISLLDKKITIMDPISVTEGLYDGIRIDASSSISYISIYEITIGTQEKPDQPGTEEPNPENPEPSGNKAILVVTMTTGLEKEYDLSMDEVNAFINWYDTKDAGSGPSKYAINKHNNNIGPFNKRTDYVIFNNILTFEVNEYSTTTAATYQ